MVLNILFCLRPFQVTGRESLRTEAQRPVKIAESDADVSGPWCLCVFLPPRFFLVTDKSATFSVLCVCLLSSFKQGEWRQGSVKYTATQWGLSSRLHSEGLSVSTTAFIFLAAI